MLGTCLVVVGLCAITAALLFGPLNFQFNSLDDLFAADVPERALLAVGGLVLSIVGWVLRGSGQYD
jgi:hypothetical protein